MSGVVPAIPRLKFTNATGVPVVSGSVAVYLAGTSTLANTYQDKALTILNNNPVPLDGNGEALFWLDPSLTYKFLLKDANNATVTGWPVDNILGGGNSPTLQQSYVDTFSGDGSQTVFTLSAAPGNIKDTNVYVGGVYQKKSAYNLAGSTLTFVSAPTSGTNNIEVTYYVLLDFTGLAATISGYSAAAAASASDAQTSALAASTSETNAAGSVTAINNRIYPGTYTVAPTTRPDGSARQAGDEYFNATANLRYTFNGTTWVASDINTANLAASSGSSLVGFIQAGTGAVARTLQDKDRDVVSVFDFMTTAQIADVKAGTLALDVTTAIQAALNTGATEVYAPAGQYLVSSTLFLKQAQTLRGPRRSNYVTLDSYGAVIVFRTAAADTCITNTASTDSSGVEDIQFDLNSNANFAVGFLTSYANKVKRCSFRGTMDVGIYLQDTYVCELDEVAFTGASVKHYCVYLGATNATTVRRIHTSSTYPNDNTIAMVGVGVYTGKGVTIESPVFQGVTIGVSLYTPVETAVGNPYFENALCNMRLGDPNAPGPAYGTTVRGGTFSSAYNTHPQYASRGPLVYLPRAANVTLAGPSFLNTNATDANTWPVLETLTTGPLVMQNAYYFGGVNSRAQVFKEISTASTSHTIIGETYGSFGATEILLKNDGNFGGNSYGIRVGNTGTVTTVAWTPTTITGSVNALLTAAFVVPTMP